VRELWRRRWPRAGVACLSWLLVCAAAARAQTPPDGIPAFTWLSVPAELRLPAVLAPTAPAAPAGAEPSGTPEPGNTEAGGDARVEKPEESGFPLRARFDDGILLETTDHEYQMRLHLMNQTDFKVFAPGNQEPARSGIYNPRFRIYFEGRLTTLFDYELSLQRSVEGAFDVLDANVNFHFCEPFQIKFGRFLVPYSYDWYDHLEQYFITPERGLFPLNFGLSREAGLMAHGRLFDGRVQYAVGGFDGQLLGLADTNTTRDAVMYLNTRPFLRTEQYPALRFLNMGGSFAIGSQAFSDTPLPLRTSVQSSENDEAAQAASAVFLQWNDGVVARGGRTQGALHLAYYYQHLSVETEFQIGRFSYQAPGAANPVAIPCTGYHVTLGYFITGETVEGRTTVVPLRPFDPTHGRWGPGAVELFGRYSELSLSDRIFTNGLADPALWSRSAVITDTGFNWYLNRYIKFYCDWQHSDYGSPVQINAGEHKFSKKDDLYWIRCQLYF
jgi:phosphate-selective porin OprO/OprP